MTERIVGFWVVSPRYFVVISPSRLAVMQLIVWKVSPVMYHLRASTNTYRGLPVTENTFV